MFTRFILIATCLLFVLSCNAQNNEKVTPSSKWEVGKHYFLIEPPQPIASGNKVEVVEVFSYACPHCAHFQIYADQFRSGLPKNATFNYLPAVFNPSWELFARAFYTAQNLGVQEKTHQALFDAIHRDHKPLHTIEDLATFYANYGVKSETFLSTASSFVIEGKLSHASQLVHNYQIEGTPTLIINGKYRISANGETGVGYPEMIEIANYLVAQEAALK